MADKINLMQRDPNDLNSHVQVKFEEVFGEPEGVRSMDCVWINSYKCFECGKNLCYMIMTTLCGICIALGWGCEFAMLSFDHVWCWTPCMRELSIVTGCIGKLIRVFTECCIAPCCEACGSMFSRIKITKG